MGAQYKNILKGDRYERLTYSGEREYRKIGKNQKQNVYIKCICDCGNYVWLCKSGFKINGNKGRGVKSCGCLRAEVGARNKQVTAIALTKHGISDSRFYSIYRQLTERCNNQKCKSYKDYGGRGIKNCWVNFQDFMNDMYGSYLLHVKEFGQKDTTIDRISIDGNYCKDNCRWATRHEQANNKRNSLKYFWKGKAMSLKDIILLEGISTNYKAIWYRLNKGRSLEKALYTDPNLYHNKG